MQGQLPNEARCPKFDLSLYLHPYYVWASSEATGASVKRRRVWALADADQIFNP